MRKSVWVTGAAIVMVLALMFYFVRMARQPKDPVARLQRLVGPFSIMVAPYNAKVALPARPVILIRQRWAKLRIHKDGWGYQGTTGVDVEISLPGRDKKLRRLRQSFAEALNRSPELACKVFQHPDSRVRYVALGMARHQALSGSPSQFKPALAPHVFEALGTVVKDEGDPFLPAEACDVLWRANQFRLPVFQTAVNHPSAHVKVAATRYADRLLKRLSAEQLRAVVGAVVDHLDDRDGVARGFCYRTLGLALREMESELGGVKTSDGNAWPGRTVKLPELPMRYVDIATMDWSQAAEVKRKWKEWLDSPALAEGRDRGPE